MSVLINSPHILDMFILSASWFDVFIQIIYLQYLHVWSSMVRSIPNRNNVPFRVMGNSIFLGKFGVVVIFVAVIFIHGYNAIYQ